MTPGQLHRAVLTATAFGDDARYAQLRGKFGPHDARGEFEHREGAAAACLAVRLGTTAEQAGRLTDGSAGPSAADRRIQLGRFMAELRAAGYEYGPPSDFLEVEGVIRVLVVVPPPGVRRALPGPPLPLRRGSAPIPPGARGLP